MRSTRRYRYTKVNRPPAGCSCRSASIMKRKDSTCMGRRRIEAAWQCSFSICFPTTHSRTGPPCSAAWPVARRIYRLKHRARGARIPVIYANDNLARRWAATFPRWCVIARTGDARRNIADARSGRAGLLRSQAQAFGFFRNGARHIIAIHWRAAIDIYPGIRHQCVLFTANDAYVRDIEFMHSA